MKTRLLKKLRKEAAFRYYVVELSKRGPYAIYRHFDWLDDFICVVLTKEEAIETVDEYRRMLILRKIHDIRRSKAKRLDY